jgi:hypothetical protein
MAAPVALEAQAAQLELPLADASTVLPAGASVELRFQAPPAGSYCRPD